MFLEFFDLFPTWLIVLTIAFITYPIYAVYQSMIKVMQIKVSQKPIKEKNILFIIAHPDDEAM